MRKSRFAEEQILKILKESEFGRARRIAGIRERHAGRLVGMGRASCRYRSKRPVDTEFRERMRELARGQPRELDTRAWTNKKWTTNKGHVATAPSRPPKAISRPANALSQVRAFSP